MTGRRSSNARAAAAVVSIVIGGCAFGAITGTTLAAWQDEESTVASFAAGTFDTQSQGTGDGWTHHEAASPASLGAEITGLAPGGTASEPAAGQSHYSAFRIRTSEDSSRGGTVRVSAVNIDGALARALEYRVVVGDGRDCEVAADDPASELLVGGPQSYQPASSSAGSDTEVTIGAHGSDPAELCLDLRIAAPSGTDSGDDVQGAAATAVLTVAVTQN
ncbi:SipW-cognate class signal peptide [Brevibacterium siliguriense]|uniref:SipW-cognate class signal peptide n=1 Tax=Brevibacterium siliguriense TaxID=1136497 RepID=A0A1H1QSB2_9MICO|nr:SipW-dependent-type signal peptide-containing protein [Brevibacterium siliguriense]SDS26350.1 SipW-cognate class signal peptide [Brevibacterium siliguriense]